MFGLHAISSAAIAGLTGQERSASISEMAAAIDSIAGAYLWNDIADTPESWSPTGDNAETWTNIADNSETWTPIS